MLTYSISSYIDTLTSQVITSSLTSAIVVLFESCSFTSSTAKSICTAVMFPNVNPVLSNLVMLFCVLFFTSRCNRKFGGLPQVNYEIEVT